MSGRTIGADTGGTFTDVVLCEGRERRVAKVSSQREDPGGAVVAGLERLGGVGRGDDVVHGTTVALNALLTGDVARTALVTNEGFADLLEIGRQDRADIYDLEPRTTDALVPRRRRLEVPQRIWPRADGGGWEHVREPTLGELAALAERVRASGAASVAVCLLHAWAEPAIERRVADALAGLDLLVTCSAELLPEHREFERFSTAVVNAALAPRMAAYLGGLEPRLGGARLYVLQSSGGTLTAERAAREPARVILSGPAGGVVGAARAAREAGFDAFCALDMGGTSTDVAFHTTARSRAGDAAIALEPPRVAGHPVGVPSLDIHTIGCGGGSLVRVDAGGVLHVGPESAGAEPGPVAYGRSDRPTVTDAHVLLGHVAQGTFLGGALALDTDAVERAFEQLARRLGTTPVDAARGVLDVARASMRRAVSVMTMQRGHDPHGLPLVAFGGAGGLHGAALAASLGMRAALVPRHPGALSAVGMTEADAAQDLATTALEPLSSWSPERRERAFRALEREGAARLAAAGVARARIRSERALDLRYAGQSFELRLPAGRDPARAFHAAHERHYGYRLDAREIELVCLRVRAFAPVPLPRARTVPTRRLASSAIVGERRAVFERAERTRVLAREALAPGTTFRGPALVEEYSGTTLVPPGWRARVTAGGHLLLQP